MRCPRLSNIQLSRSGDLASWPELLSIAGWYARRCPRTRAAVETRSSCLPYGRVVLIVSRRYSCRTDAVHSAPCHASTGTPHTPNAQLRTQRTELSALGPVRGAHAERDQPLLHQARHAPTADTACQLSSLGCSCDRNSRVLRHCPSESTISAPMPGTAFTSIAASRPSLRSTQTRFGRRSVALGPRLHNTRLPVCVGHRAGRPIDSSSVRCHDALPQDKSWPPKIDPSSGASCDSPSPDATNARARTFTLPRAWIGSSTCGAGTA